MISTLKSVQIYQIIYNKISDIFEMILKLRSQEIVLLYLELLGAYADNSAN